MKKKYGEWSMYCIDKARGANHILQYIAERKLSLARPPSASLRTELTKHFEPTHVLLI